jgi:hypothetical protein
MRAMLNEPRLPLEFWDEAVEHDAYISGTAPILNQIQIA